MYAKLQDLIGRKDRPRLRQFVQNANVEELSRTLCDNIYSTDIIKLLDEVLKALCNTDKPSEKKLKVVKAIVKALGNDKISNNVVEEIIGLLAMDFPNYPKNFLMQLVQFSISNISSNEDECRSWKDLLPVLLEILEQEKYVNYMDLEVTGNEYKSLIVKSICNSNWEPDVAVCLAKMFGDMTLDKKDLNVVITVLCHKLPMIALNEIPPFVYQTLRLCSNHSCIYLITSLQKYFASHYSDIRIKEKEKAFETISTTSLKEIQDAESNVLFHIHHATQLHYKCIKDLILTFKKFSMVPEYILEPFILSTLLVMSSVHEDQVFEILHQAILRKIQDDEKCKNSAWLRSLIPANRDIMSTMDEIIENSDKDRHVILKGIMDLGFVLLDTEQSVGKVGKYSMHKIGIKILQKLMKKRHEICGSVLQLLTEKIVAGGLLISQYTDCLAYICRKLTMVMLDYQTYIITLLDQLLWIPGIAATQILYAILPLIYVSSNIKDNIMLTLRKALYRKGVDTRKMAVTGFLELLKMLKMKSLRNLPHDHSINSFTSTASGSASILTQVTLEKHNEMVNMSGYNKRLCCDILNILKKCFTQEFEVRLYLYEGLYDVVVKNPEMSEYIVEMLLAQLNLYFETDENITPPLKIDQIADVNDIQIIPREPIATLVYVVQKIYVRIGSEDREILNRIAVILESLCARMVQTETEHINIDNATELLENTPKSQQKLHNVKQMIGIYEALISFRIHSWSTESKNIAKSIHNLFKGYNRFMDIVKNMRKKRGNKNKKNKDVNDTTLKKTSRPDAIKLPSGNMSLDTVCKILELHYSDQWLDNNEAKILRSYREFYQYTLQSCISAFQAMISLSTHEFDRTKKQHVQIYYKIGELLYENVILKFRSFFYNDPEGALLSLECFREYCGFICSKFSSQLPQFLHNMCQIEQTESLNTQLQAFILSLKAPFKMTLSQDHDEKEFFKQLSLMLLEIIQQFVHQLNFQEKNTEKIFEWIKKYTQIEEIDAATAMLILQILLWMEDCDKDYGEILNDISFELSEKLGMIHKVETTASEKYKIIYGDTVVQAYNVLNCSIERKVNNASWFLKRLNAEHAIANSVNIDKEESADNIVNRERSLCRQLSYIIQILHTLANISIDPGQANFIFRNLQHLYNTLSKLTKYFYNKSSSENAAFHAVRFIQVIQLAGKPLKSAFYNLVTHIEESQSKDPKRLKSDSSIQKNSMLKETKLIPRVVYEIEQFSKEVLLLAKKTKIPLENYIKHSITRDFRILDSRLTEALEQMDVSMLNTQRTNATGINSSLPHDLDDTSSPTKDISTTEL
ncbi:hypothetical protein KPH14_006755 [Odynerus spinipes]|uniref:Fanconi anemia group I protein n=1 Tax=Odynerus spinipes TaxID=1348599 RepID=A0AAD9RR79_9HYME|nr:hypothetical protein KPH14_006755 [Odynerus spinipes]